jgi:hypothetical protein
LAIEAVKRRSTTHGNTAGYRRSKEYRAWIKAIGRCDNPTDHKFRIYGGRGIRVEEPWRSSFVAFLRDMGPCPPGRSLDRIDVNGNYAPGNCRWATPRQQAANTRKNVYVEFNGQRMILKDLARHLGVNYARLHALVRYGGADPVAAAQAMAASQ